MKYFKLLIITAAIIFAIILTTHNVSNQLTSEDKAVLGEVLDTLTIDKDSLASDFRYQIKTIKKIQYLALEVIKPGYSKPIGEIREPKELMEYGKGECFDRSRFLQKAFCYVGLKSRRLSIYSNPDNVLPLKLILSANALSHSVMEVKTSNGWILVDSNVEWMGLDKQNQPISYKMIKKGNVDFKDQPIDILKPFYNQDNLIIYGFYSRHGNFYPPFNKVPDYNLRELLFNL